jgi:DNA-binding transcriptional LysR family regulator
MYSTADLQLFVRAAEAGNLSQAARDLGLSPAVASAGLKRLEARLKHRLFVRSTRSMRPTPEGDIFLDYARNALALLDEGEAMISAGEQVIRGNIRISASCDLGRFVLLPWLSEFQRQHPEVSLSLLFSDDVVDLVREPVDLALRYGRLTDSSLVSQKLIDNRPIVIASPDYVKRHGAPQSPKDLARHNCVLYQIKKGTFNTWPLYNGAETVEVKVRGDRTANDGSVVREWAVAGLGIALKSGLDVREDLQAGRLLRLLPQWTGPDYPLNVVYTHRHGTTLRARALLAFLRAKLEPLAPLPGVS